MKARGGLMGCLRCASANQPKFPAEMIIHFTGFKNVDKPGGWAFPSLLVCLDCGFSRFAVPETELRLLAAGAPTRDDITARENVDDGALRSGNADQAREQSS